MSGYYNNTYDPTVSGSGAASYTGNYSLTLTRLGAGDTRVSGISAAATSGTPAKAGVASANVGQTITLNGSGFVSTDQVVFTGLEDGGNLTGITVTPATIAADGTS